MSPWGRSEATHRTAGLTRTGHFYLCNIVSGLFKYGFGIPGGAGGGAPPQCHCIQFSDDLEPVLTRDRANLGFLLRRKSR
jgi:hypothetical protein